MAKNIIKDGDKFINAKDVCEIFAKPTIFKRKAEDYQRLKNISGNDPSSISDLSKYFVGTFESITPKEINNKECIYLITKETAYKILKNEFNKLLRGRINK